nr:helix-turn-helix transcriptional regulator [uncultured Ruminococcus sp.]
MEFNEKLQKLRKEQNLTQEELAEKLFVSRTAISKWESGRGYPSIDSLKVIAKYFHVTIDELIGGEEIVTLAEQDIKENNKKHTALICGVLDCFVALLLFLPLFGNGDSSGASVTVFSLTGVSEWLKIMFIVVIGLTVLNGFCGVVLSNFDKPVWNKHRLITGLGLSILATVLFIVTRQPYAGVFYLFVLIIKGILFLKSK